MGKHIQNFLKKKILLAQAASPSLSNSYKCLHERFGIEVNFLSFTTKRPITVPTFRKHKQIILKHTALIFTSALAIDYFFKLAKASHIQLPITTKYFFPNPALAYYLQKHTQLRKRKVFTGKKYLEDLAPIFKKFKNEHYLLLCSNIKNANIKNFLRNKDYNYTELPIYSVTENKLPEEILDTYDLIVFFSPVDVNIFKKRFPNFNPGIVQFATFGKSTGEAAESLGWKPLIKAPQVKAPSMLNALEHYFQDNMLAFTNFTESN